MICKNSAENDDKHESQTECTCMSLSLQSNLHTSFFFPVKRYLHGISSFPCGRSAANYLDPVITASIVPPLVMKELQSRDIFIGM